MGERRRAAFGYSTKRRAGGDIIAGHFSGFADGSKLTKRTLHVHARLLQRGIISTIKLRLRGAHLVLKHGARRNSDTLSRTRAARTVTDPAAQAASISS